MNKTEIKTVNSAVKHGFTFTGDSFFSSFIQAKRTVNSLIRKGYLIAKSDARGFTEYLPTETARDFVKYGI